MVVRCFSSFPIWSYMGGVHNMYFWVCLLCGTRLETGSRWVLFLPQAWSQWVTLSPVTPSLSALGRRKDKPLLKTLPRKLQGLVQEVARSQNWLGRTDTMWDTDTLYSKVNSVTGVHSWILYTIPEKPNTGTLSIKWEEHLQEFSAVEKVFLNSRCL